MGNTFESRGGNGQVIEVDMGPIPENPSNASDKDIKALEKYHNYHPDKFPSSKYIDVRGWKNWRNISIQYNEDNNKWNVSYNRFSDGEIKKNDFDKEQEATKYFNEQKQYNKQIALDLIREARNFAIGEDLEAPWTDSVDISAETPSPAAEAISSISASEGPAEGEESQVEEGVADSGELTPGESPEEAEDEGVSGDELPEAEPLQAELDRLINESVKKENNKVTETVGKLARIEGREYTGEVDSEEIVSSMEVAILRENARQSILEYQKFIEINRNNLKDEKIYNQYRIIEKKAWSQVSKFTHKLGGEIATLSQERDIQLAHPEVVDIEKYLIDGGKIVLDAEGHITHLNINGNIIELNRPRTIDELLRAPRPTRILYHSGTPISEDDPTKQNYKGLVISGLNENTLEWIEGVLSDKQFLESVIVDETTQQNPELDGNQEEVAILGNAGNVLDSETITQSPEQDEGGQMILSNKKNTVDFEVVDDPESAKLLEEMEPIDLVDRLAELREQYARAEEAWNRKPGDEKLEDTFIAAREAYNTELERVLKLQVAEGQADNISKMFKDEVMSLRDSRIEQSQELQGVWEKRFNNAKEKFLGWATQNKTRWMLANISLFAAGALLSWTGAGIPVSGALEMTRRSLGSVMSGVSSRNTLVGLMEDGEINRFGIKFKAVIPKLVDESLKDDYTNNASDDDLRTKLSTLEAYYRLNGGEFTKENQQQAYEKVLTELARRVQENVIDAEQNQDELQSDWQEQKPENLTEGEILEKAHQRWDERNPLSRNMRYFLDRDIQKERDLQNKAEEDWKKSNPERYTSELLNTISDTRIAELDEFRRKRKIATGIGVLVTGIGAGALLNDMVKPGGMFGTDMGGSGKPPTTGGSTPDTQGPGAGTGGASAPETGAGVTKPNLETTTPPTGTGAATEEAVRQARAAAAVAAAAEQAQELAQDVSSLDSGETISNQIARWLGAGASEAQIQQAVENYLQSQAGQESIFELAQQTEGGRELLARWSIDNADAMAKLELKDLYEVSKYLGEGKLDGLTELSLDNLDALSPAEYVESSPVVEPTIEPGSTEPPAPPASESTVVPPTSEAPPVAPSEFTRDLSEILGKQNLTDIQAREIVQSYFADDYGRVAIYNSIINTDEGARFLSQGFNINNLAGFANLTPDKMYEITNSLDADSWRRIINETVLSKFETADIVEIAKGDSPLGAINRYIAGEVGNLPYDANLGKQVLDTYIQTDTGKQWLYDAIVSNPNPNNQNVQLFREYLRFRDIKSSEEFVTKFNWSEFSVNRNIPTSGFWNQIRLPNGGAKLQPLSTFLQPSKMTGIPEVIKQVLTRQ